MSERGVNERLVGAAQRGDRRAQEEIARTCLPLVYNVVGRALGAPGDIADAARPPPEWASSPT